MGNIIETTGSLVYAKYPKEGTFEKHFNLRFSVNTKNLKIRNLKANVEFMKNDNKWIAEVYLSENGKNNICFHGDRAYISIPITRSKILPEEIKEIIHDPHPNISKSFFMNVRINNLNQISDTGLRPWDFLNKQEIHAKLLMQEALNNGFSIEFIPKGWAYDLQLTSPRKSKLLISIFYYKTKNEKRNRAKRAQKLLGDISKLLPEIYNKEHIPIMVSQEFMNNNSRTILDYVNFYKNQFNFKFINTNFKKGWEREVLNKLLEIDKNV